MIHLSSALLHLIISLAKQTRTVDGTDDMPENEFLEAEEFLTIAPLLTAKLQK